MTVSVAMQQKIVDTLLECGRPVGIAELTDRMRVGSNVIRMGIAQIRTNGSINGYCVTMSLFGKTNLYSAKRSLERWAVSLRSSPIPMRIQHGAN